MRIDRAEVKETPINIRAKASQRELIDMAVSLLSQSRTDFVLDTACREAEEVLLDQCLFVVDEAQFSTFFDAIAKPVVANERLHALLDRKSPWE